MLLELAIGDAYGVGFEYANTDFVRLNNDLSCYRKHPRHHITPGHYSDDTQMSIAVAEAIISGKPWTPLMLADRFVDVFKRDPREGYAQNFYHFLVQVENGEQFLRNIRPASEKSGAAMRAAPIGIFPNIDQVIEYATIQARITHDTLNGINSAVAAALMTHYFLYQLGPKKKLGAFLEKYVDGNWTRPWRGFVGSLGLISVHAAVTAVIESTRMSDLLQRCIAFTGDVDTVATIALAAGSCCKEIAQDLPEHLVERLEQGAYGHDYLCLLDAQLMTFYERKN